MISRLSISVVTWPPVTMINVFTCSWRFIGLMGIGILGHYHRIGLRACASVQFTMDSTRSNNKYVLNS